MESPFAMFPPEGLIFEPPNNTNKFVKYAKFALYNLPQILDKYSSSRLCDDYKITKSKRKHKRKNSIVIESAGILVNACKHVSFSPNIQTIIYKKDEH